MPHMWGVVTARTALAATAASAAEPPRCNIATPAADARWSTDATMPLGAWRVTVGTVADYGPEVPHAAAPVREPCSAVRGDRDLRRCRSGRGRRGGHTRQRGAAGVGGRADSGAG